MHRSNRSILIAAIVVGVGMLVLAGVLTRTDNQDPPVIADDGCFGTVMPQPGGAMGGAAPETRERTDPGTAPGAKSVPESGTDPGVAPGADSGTASSEIAPAPPGVPITPGGGVDVTNAGQRIVRTTNLCLEAEPAAVGDTAGRATTITERAGGFATSSTVQSDAGDGTSWARLVLRVPADTHTDTVTDLKGLGTHVREESNSEDASGATIDLETQLTSWKAEEQVYLRLLEQATSLEEIVTVRTQLQPVQETIARLQAQLDHLQDQTEYATITLDIRTAGAGAPVGPLARAWSVAVDGLADAAVVLLVLALWLLPVTLVAGVVTLAVRAARQRRGGGAEPAGRPDPDPTSPGSDG